MLKQKGIKHQVLNAKYHEMEAHIIAQAGRYKAVTIATNMAGRGTDIVLGGNAEYLAKTLLIQKTKDKKDISDSEQEEMLKKFVDQFKQQTKEEQKKVLDLGGLHVIGTERHESRRIDNQLRGRQGRQGDPGASKFYVSLEDDLMRLFGSDRMIGLMDKMGMEQGQNLEHPWLTKAIENAQRRVEGHNFEIRKHLIEFDNVMNKQREVIYKLRKTILEKENVKGFIIDALEDLSSQLIWQHLSTQDKGQATKEGVDALETYLKTKYHCEVKFNIDENSEIKEEDIRQTLLKGLISEYENKEQKIEKEQLRYLERMILLNAIDSKWKEHLYAMDQLKEGIGLRSFGQRDPVIEYKKEGFAMFQDMCLSINQEVAEFILQIQSVSVDAPSKGVFNEVPQNLVHKEMTSLSTDGIQSPQDAVMRQEDRSSSRREAKKVEPMRKENGEKVGRNEPCPCGSGKKYKKCCGR